MGKTFHHCDEGVSYDPFAYALNVNVRIKSLSLFHCNCSGDNSRNALMIELLSRCVAQCQAISKVKAYFREILLQSKIRKTIYHILVSVDRVIWRK